MPEVQEKIASSIITSENLQQFQFNKLGITKDESKEEIKEEVKEEIKEEKSDEELKEEALKEDEHKEKKRNKFSERISEVTKQRNAERERADALEARLKALEEKDKPKEEVKTDGRPNPKDFTDAFDYAEKLAEWSAKEAIKNKEKEDKERAAKEAKEKVGSIWQERLAKAKEELPDFDDLVASSDLMVSQEMQEAIVDSEQGAYIFHHLLSNPEEHKKLLGMTVPQMLKAIGKLETKFEKTEERKEGKEEKPKLEKSSAPAPITPIRGGKASGEPVDSNGEVTVGYQEFRRLRKEGKIR